MNDERRNFTVAPRTTFGRRILYFEVGLLAVLFLAIVVLGLTQIGLRNLADSSLAWADAAMRAGVLWIAMLASALAAGQLKHIRIDLLGRLLPDPWRQRVERVVFALTSLVCLAMTAASMRIVFLEYEFGEPAFPGVARWVVLAIIPIGFALMGWRFMRHALLPTEPDRPEPDTDVSDQHERAR